MWVILPWLLFLLLRPAVSWDQTLPWVPRIPTTTSRGANNHTIHAPYSGSTLLSTCPGTGKASLSAPEVRLRPGTSSRCSWTLHSPDGLPVCRLKVAVVALDLPCGVGSLQIASEFLCGGVLGARTVDLPPDTREVPVSFSYVGSGHKDFDVVVGLEGCVKEETQVVANHDCGGLYHVAVGRPVGLLSPGYPAHYPDKKNCLYILQHVSGDLGPPACYLDLEFVDFTLESSSGCEKDRFVVEGAEGAVFCGSRGGTTRLELADRKEARLRFLSDDEGTAGGFRVLASLSRCEAIGDPRQETVSPTDPTPAPRPEGSMGELLVPGPPVPLAADQWPQCCGRVHSGPRVFITSPGFPAGLGGAECVFPIARLAPTFCRLRLVLHQFLLAGPCDKHFLEVDGRRLCACHSRTQMLAFFQSPGDMVKLLRYARSPFTPGGFIIEVVQEDCSFPTAGPRPRAIPLQGLTHSSAAATSPWNITNSIKRSGIVGPSPDVDPHPEATSATTIPPASSPSGRSARILFGGLVRFPEDTVQSPVVGAKRLHDDALPASAPLNPSLFDLISSYYTPFNQSNETSPLESSLYWNSTSSTPSQEGINPADPSFEELSTRLLADEANAKLGLGVCGAPTFKSWMSQAASWASTVPSALVQCPVGIFPPAKCRELRGPSGWFSSPGYPEPYPNNIRACYRIVRYPSQCGVQLSMLDFDVEPSPTCSKDYLSLGGASRYCGASLASSLLNLDFMAGDYTDVLFVTDGAVTGRGFRAFYRQQPCAVAPVLPGITPGILPGVPGVPGDPGAFYPSPFFPAGAGAGPILPPGQIPASARYPFPAPVPAPVPAPFPRPVPVSSGPYQPSGAPERPTRPGSTPPPTPTPNPFPPPSPSARTCGGEVRQQHFALTSRDVAGRQECVFIVRRITEDICGLQIFPERIDVDCRREVVVVDGRTFCGREMQGQTVTLDFFGDSMEIVYRSEAGELAVQGDFVLHMQQVADCLDLDVTPVARVGKSVYPRPLPAPACVAELPANEGVLLAPALEPRAPHDLSCSYAFRQRPGSCYLQLQFHEFHLAAGPICTDSYLALRNHKYCGVDLRHSNHVFTFTSPTLEVPYHLQRDIPLARWNISYSQIPCRSQKPQR